MTEVPFGGFVRWPRLSVDLPYPRAIDTCQSCGATPELGAELQRWCEHDDEDEATPVVVILCATCAKRIIEPHRRLYSEIPANKPWPGAMDCCSGCRFAIALECNSPSLKRNGGPGVAIDSSAPERMHVNMGRKRHLWLESYRRPPVCHSREEPTPERLL